MALFEYFDGVLYATATKENISFLMFSGFCIKSSSVSAVQMDEIYIYENYKDAAFVASLMPPVNIGEVDD